MKHFLSLSGYGSAGKRKFSDIRPTATLLLHDCMAGWPLLQEVESNEFRFKHAEPRPDLPTLEEAKKIYRIVDPQSFPKMTSSRIWAATLNTKLNRVRAQQRHSCVRGLPALSFVLPPKRANQAPMIFLVTDKVHSTIHLVGCRRQQRHGQEGQEPSRYVLRMPLTFAKSHDVFLRFSNC